MIADQYEQMQQRYCCTGEPYVRARDVAKHLDLNPWTIYKMAQRNQIPSHKIGKGRRFKISEVEAAIA